jgi:hypothetical protein
MAIDTLERRLSMATMGGAVPRTLPLPSGGFSDPDRSHLLMLFAESFAPPVPPDPGDDVAQQGVKTPFAKILKSIRQRLLDVLSDDEIVTDPRLLVTANRILFARIDRVPRWQGPVDIVLRVTAPRPQEGLWDGGGVVTPALVRGLVVEIRTRSSIDQSDRVDLWLLDFQTVLEDAVMLALLGHRAMELDYDPDATSEDVLTIEEMSLTSGAEYKDTLEKIPKSTDNTWGSSMLVFRISYCSVARDLPEVEE